MTYVTGPTFCRCVNLPKRTNVNVNRALVLLRPWCISSKRINEVRKMDAFSPETLKLLQSFLDDAWEISDTRGERADN